MSLPKLGAPPDQGITAWMEDNGLYARVYPVPPIGMTLLKRIATLFGLVVLLAALMLGTGYGEELAANPWYLIYPSVFVVMVALLQHMSGFFPTEVAIDGEMLVWDSDRIPMTSVASCTVEADGRLVVRRDGGDEVASVLYLKRDVADWLADAINQSRSALGDPTPPVEDPR